MPPFSRLYHHGSPGSASFCRNTSHPHVAWSSLSPSQHARRQHLSRHARQSSSVR